MLFEPTLNLDDLNGINGLTLNGSSGPVSNIGDINGDGFDDVIIGPPGFRYDRLFFDFVRPIYPQRRESYLVFGGQKIVGGDLNLPTLDEPNGFVLDIDFEVARTAGDINGDGFDDLLISFPEANPDGIDNAGESYVVFGSSDISNNNFDLTALDGSNGFAISGIAANDFAGSDANAAGDVNGDGLDDIIIGAPFADRDGLDRVGESYVVFGASNFDSGRLELADLNGQNGFVINGIDSGDTTGRSVSGAGDINGDGIDDFLIGASAPILSGLYEQTAGEAYIVFGGQDFSSGNFDLTALDGSNGFVAFAIPDIEGYSFLRASVSSAGDINGDGLDDIVIGIPNSFLPYSGTYAGKSYVVFGSRDDFTSSLDLANLDGTDGLIISNTDEIEEFGQSVSGISDINGDGFDDFLIGTSPVFYSGNYYFLDVADRSYVIFGRPDFSDSPLDAAELDGSDGFTIPVGTSVSSAGDFNGDGLNDFIVGDGNGNETGGVSYIVFGRDPEVPVFRTDAATLTTPENMRFSTDLEANDNLDSEGNGLTYSLTGGADQALFSLDAADGQLSLDFIPDFENSTDADQDNTYEVEVTVTDSDGFSRTEMFAIDVTDVSLGNITPADLDGSNSFVIEGIEANDRLGRLVGTAGDVNGDGFDDVIIGASGPGYGSPPQFDELYVVFGGADFSGDRPNLAELESSDGFVIEGSNLTASNAGDINNDGIDDLIIGASEANANGLEEAGQAFVLFGRPDFSSRRPDLNALDGTNGFVINGLAAGDGAGFAVSAAGDVNADSIDDIVIGAPFAEPITGRARNGESYVIFGGQNFSDGTLDLATLDGSNGFIISNSVQSGLGTSLSDVGDVNGDGIDDVAIGASRFSQDYVIFGGQDFSSGRFDIAVIDGSNGFGVSGITYAASRAGDVNGDGFDDVVFEVGNFARESYIVFGQSDFSVDPFPDIRTISNGRDGFQTNSPATGLGDINNDGFDDLIVGADGFFVVNSFVRFGGPDPDIAELSNPRGFSISTTDERDRFGSAVGNAGDVNGDGVNDIIIGAPLAAPNGIETAGETYVIFSGNILNPPSLVVDAVLAVPENNTAVVDVNATDDRSTETNGLIYRITDGADQDLFAIDPFTGELSFTTAPDFEAPSDADGDNIYEVVVAVTNGVDLSDTQLLTITVLDIDENGNGGDDPILFATGDGNLVLGDFDIDEGAEFGSSELTFDTLELLDGAFQGTYATTRDFLDLTFAIENDFNGDTDALRDGDDLIFSFGNGDSIRLEDVFGRDGLTVERFDAVGGDVLPADAIL